MMKNLNRKNSISQNQTEKNGETQTRKRINLKKAMAVSGYTLKIEMLGAEIYQKNNEELVFMGFRSQRQTKPAFNYRFKNEEQRDQYIENFFKPIFAKNVAKKQQKEFKHNYAIGDIFVNSWGYDQTKVDFYQVVAKTDKSVSLREIAQEVVPGTSGLDCCKVLPLKDQFHSDKVFRKNVQYGKDYLAGEYGCYTPFDGKPKYSSWYA